jgi:hypothetical protein
VTFDVSGQRQSNQRNTIIKGDYTRLRTFVIEESPSELKSNTLESITISSIHPKNKNNMQGRER